MIRQRLTALMQEHPNLLRPVRALRSRWRASRGDRLGAFLSRVTEVVDHPVFVKVGANDGLTGDPCGALFLRNANWSGLLIEPVPYCFEKLRQTYRDQARFTLDQVAVGSQPGVVTFYYVSQDARQAIPDLPDWYDQIGSLDRRHIVKHLGGMLEPFIVEMAVKVEPLGSILRRHGIARVDLLHVDTEGHDLQVLRSLDFSEHTPLAIFVEHKHLSPDDRAELRELLRSADFNVEDMGSDFFAVHHTARRVLAGPAR